MGFEALFFELAKPKFKNEGMKFLYANITLFMVDILTFSIDDYSENTRIQSYK